MSRRLRHSLSGAYSPSHQLRIGKDFYANRLLSAFIGGAGRIALGLFMIAFLLEAGIRNAAGQVGGILGGLVPADGHLAYMGGR